MADMQVVTLHRQQGTGKASNRAYDFFVVGGIVRTSRGQEFAEVILDADSNKWPAGAVMPEVGKSYHLAVESYPDSKTKRLTFRVVAFSLPGDIKKRRDVAQCVTMDAAGVLTPTADAVESCAGFVLVTPGEFSMMQGVLQPLTVEEGITIGGAIFLAWAVAFGIRMVGQVVWDAEGS